MIETVKRYLGKDRADKISNYALAKEALKLKVTVTRLFKDNFCAVDINSSSKIEPAKNSNQQLVKSYYRIVYMKVNTLQCNINKNIGF